MYIIYKSNPSQIFRKFSLHNFRRYCNLAQSQKGQIQPRLYKKGLTSKQGCFINPNPNCCITLSKSELRVNNKKGKLLFAENLCNKKRFIKFYFFIFAKLCGSFRPTKVRLMVKHREKVY
jgi:hypothetical protein